MKNSNLVPATLEQPRRLDQFLVAHYPAYSRSYLQRLCAEQQVLVNGKPQRSSFTLKAGDTVELLPNLATTQQHAALDLLVVYEDNDCVVINKPLGVLTHSKGAFNPEATVATWLQPHLKPDWRHATQGSQSARTGIVHRLDRATSGVMICAKTPQALSWLQKQFSLRKVKKTYIALIKGQLDPASAIIDMPIERNPKKPQTFRVGANGKSAITEYKTLKSNASYSMVELKPQTGRKHQLRVHLNQMGHPILGDTFYDGEPAERLFLHALSLEITLPNRERKVFTAPLPEAFTKKLKP